MSAQQPPSELLELLRTLQTRLQAFIGSLDPVAQLDAEPIQRLVSQALSLAGAVLFI